MTTSWKLECITKLENTYMCQYGMVSRVGGVGSGLGPAVKPTVNLCARDHKQVLLVGG